jgi:hypothetical protein
VLIQQPGQCHLCRSGALTCGHRCQQVDEGLVGFKGLLGEPRQCVAQVGVAEGRRAVDRAGEEALAERAERHEPDAELGQGREDLGFGFAPPQGVLALQRGDRLHGVGASDGIHPSFGHPEVRYLAGGDELLDRAGDLLDRRVRVDTVLNSTLPSIDNPGPSRVCTFRAWGGTFH